MRALTAANLEHHTFATRQADTSDLAMLRRWHRQNSGHLSTDSGLVSDAEQAFFGPQAFTVVATRDSEVLCGLAVAVADEPEGSLTVWSRSRGPNYDLIARQLLAMSMSNLLERRVKMVSLSCATTLLEQAAGDFGFVVLRRFLRMSRSLAGAPQVAWKASPARLSEIRTTRSWTRLRQALIDAYNRSFSEHWGFAQSDAESVGRFDEQSTICAIARYRGSVAGFIICARQHSRSPCLWIKLVGVDPRFRGHGIGRQLVLWSFSEARREGFARVVLDVDEANTTSAIALYRALGFRRARATTSMVRDLERAKPAHRISDVHTILNLESGRHD